MVLLHHTPFCWASLDAHHKQGKIQSAVSGFMHGVMNKSIETDRRIGNREDMSRTSLTLRMRLSKHILSYRGGALIILLIWMLLVPISNPRIYAVDEVGYYVYLRSLYFDHDLDFENEYRTLDALNPKSGIAAALLKPGPIKDGGRLNPVTGLYGNVAPIGAALFWSPFYVIADICVRVARLLGATVAADGYSKPYILSVCYASSLYGLLGLLLCYKFARDYATSFASTLASITIWLASPLVFYMIVQMPWSHATGFFAVAAFLSFWHSTRTQRRLRDWAILGVLAGLMTLVREQLILFLVVPAIEALWHFADHARQISRTESLNGLHAMSKVTTLLASLPILGYVACAAAFVITILPQLLVYQILNGRMRPNTEVSGKFRDTWYSPCFFHTLVDPAPCLNSPGGAFSHGALLWSPILVLGMVGIVLLWRRDRLLTLALSVALAAQMFVNGSIYTWHQSGAFGFRRFIECSPIFILGLALLIDRWVKLSDNKQRNLRSQAAAIVLALVFISWNIGLVFNWTVGHTELRRGLNWSQLVEWQLDVPRQATAKINALLFDRCKLYQNQGCENKSR